MSAGLIKMYVTFMTMGLMFFAVLSSVFARQKLTGILQTIVLVIAFICIILAGVLIILLVLDIPAT